MRASYIDRFPREENKMARSFEEIQAEMSPERRVRVEQRVTEALKAMPQGSIASIQLPRIGARIHLEEETS